LETGDRDGAGEAGRDGGVSQWEIRTSAAVSDVDAPWKRRIGFEVGANE
jgi:hypothetical protein